MKTTYEWKVTMESGLPKKEVVYETSPVGPTIRSLKETLIRGFGRSDHDKQLFRGFSPLEGKGGEIIVVK